MNNKVYLQKKSSLNLSVVIITHNEAQNISRTIESVLNAVENYPNTEIIMVDSASSDETVEIAKGYPINILRLKPSWFLSAASGRHIGTIHSKGDLIFFLDGDMELDPYWLNNAIPFAQEHPQVAAIGGYRRDVHMKNGRIINEVDWGKNSQGCVLEVKYVGGAMLCRRSAIHQVGGFQPFLKSEEEVDLCMRLRFSDFKIVNLPHLVCRHYCIPVDSLEGNLRRFKLNLWFGYGQVTRYYLGTPMLWNYVNERGTFIAPLIFLSLLIIIVIISLVSNNYTLIGIWIFICVVTLISFAIKKHSFRKALVSCLTRILVTFGAIRGFMMVPKLKQDYPIDPDFIKIVDLSENHEIDDL
ncbi:MAG: glycosyltransferase [Anaerolineaceae bacterium]|nr:glycosyltransferase [Anaerolineaceae bacterium]